MSIVNNATLNYDPNEVRFKKCKGGNDSASCGRETECCMSIYIMSGLDMYSRNQLSQIDQAKKNGYPTQVGEQGYWCMPKDLAKFSGRKDSDPIGSGNTAEVHCAYTDEPLKKVTRCEWGNDLSCNPGKKKGDKLDSCCYFFRLNDEPSYEVKKILDRAGYPFHDDGMITMCRN